MKNRGGSSTVSDSVREHSKAVYVQQARQLRLSKFSINVGEVHRALELRNRVPLVCMALKSAKFLEANALRMIAASGPPSGQSTTVTYTYEFADATKDQPAKGSAWKQLRGTLKDVFAEFGGGHAYLRRERDHFYSRKETR